MPGDSPSFDLGSEGFATVVHHEWRLGGGLAGETWVVDLQIHNVKQRMGPNLKMKGPKIPML